MSSTSKKHRTLDQPTPQEDQRIQQGIEADPDTRELSEREFSQLKRMGRPKAEVTKERITIRLSPEVLEHFRSLGPGWQTRIDEVLKEMVNQQNQ
ncbi:BrnA antitoxin family protein [Halospina sp. K52047b]|uniref:BrnA antitoxin family protein n=1 Tax=Halospina sp. K52047b TaxID=2614160 RepID=UPI00124A5EB4|nr:BrnA antitoxin family protein [Halospina sp. K52047b]KAA8985148.1 BrnA antitoxin family protein [Halospina sp. K52047b]